MAPQKTIAIESLPEALHADIFSTVNSFSTPLLKIRLGERADDKPTLIGSGTFIRIGPKSGILTAQHVADQLDGDCALGLPITKEENKLAIGTSNLNIVEIARATTPSDGPDLAFIGLGFPDVSNIRPVKSFYDLDSDKEKMIANPPELGEGIWCACGSPYVNIREEVSEIGSTAALALNSYCGFTTPTKGYEIGIYDYIELGVNYAAGPHVPATFRGTSGGGLWQVLINETSAGVLEQAGFYLSGVIFYESQRENERRFIRCHGRRSVYQAVYNAVQTHN